MTWRNIMIHCTATPVGKNYTVDDIDRWHKERGFTGIGYHFVIYLNGRVEIGRSLSQRGAHCYGWNSSTIGIAYVGGLDANGQPADTRTGAQKDALVALIEKLRGIIPIQRVMGHNEVSTKACPCFDVRKEYGW